MANSSVYKLSASTRDCSLPRKNEDRSSVTHTDKEMDVGSSRNFPSEKLYCTVLLLAFA
jgi:hypothetical protein